MNHLGVLGGSGLYAVEGLQILREHQIETPYGAPSAPIVEAELTHPTNPAGHTSTRLFFLARHGTHHQIPPHRINYRANICALKKLGVSQLVSLSAVGSMKKEIAPGDVVLVDQYIDWTKDRVSTFFEDGVVAHVSLADPICPQLHEAARAAVEFATSRAPRPRTVHFRGTYLCIQGPQFSTRAESFLYRSWGVDVIGMTAATEAKLAREAELPYVTIAMATDYDCWHDEEESVSVQSVLAVLRDNAQLSQSILGIVPRHLPDPSASPASHALRHALISHGPHSESARKNLAWLLPDLN